MKPDAASPPKPTMRVDTVAFPIAQDLEVHMRVLVLDSTTLAGKAAGDRVELTRLPFDEEAKGKVVPGNHGQIAASLKHVLM